VRLSLDGRAHEIAIDGDVVTVDGHSFTVRTAGEGRGWTVIVDGRPYTAELDETEDARPRVLLDGVEHLVTVAGSAFVLPPAAAPPLHKAPASGAAGSVAAPMAGRIIRVAVERGDTVATGDLLVVLEAMKMENELRAPAGGRVVDVHVAAGQRVAEGALLVTVS
jgi:biotin carboxyl carrier protein